MSQYVLPWVNPEWDSLHFLDLSVSFSMLGKFLLLSLQIFSQAFSLSPPSRTPVLQMLVHLLLSQRSPRRRQWQPTPVFLPGESLGWGSLVGCRLWGRTESTRLKRLSSSSRGLLDCPHFFFILYSVPQQWFPSVSLPAHLLVLLSHLFYSFLLVSFSLQLLYCSSQFAL